MIASFPLALVLDSLRLRRAGRYTWDAKRQFNRNLVPVMSSAVSPNVHCGSEPLALVSWVRCDAGNPFIYARICYVSVSGILNFPG